MPNFASLEPQDVRDYWAHEESEFTLWIADQLVGKGSSELENAIGLDIERKKPVDKYYVDISTWLTRELLYLRWTRIVHDVCIVSWDSHTIWIKIEISRN